MTGRVATLTTSFIGLGTSGATVPALVPVLAVAWMVGASEVSPLVSMLFLGLAVGVGLVAVVGSCVNASVLLVSGELLQSIGLAGLAASTDPDARYWGWAAAAILGIGFGITEVCALRLARANAGLLSTLTGILAVTSATMPVLLGVAITLDRWQQVVVGTAVFHLIGAALALRGRAAIEKSAQPVTWKASLRLRSEHVAFFAYVGAEATLAAWFGTAARVALDLSTAQAAAATAGFWLSLALGRFVAVPVLRRCPPALLLRICLNGAAMMMVAGWLLGLHRLDGLGMIIPLTLGLVLLGPVYGLLAAQAPQASSDRGMALLVAAGAMGGSAVSALSSVVVANTSIAWAVGIAAAASFAAALAAALPTSVRGGNGRLIRKR